MARRPLRIAGVIALCLAPPVDGDGASFAGLGDLDGGAFASVARAISDDGRVVVGWSASADASSEAFRWSAAEGMQGLGVFSVEDRGTRSRALGVSGDGAIVVGVGPTFYPVLWNGTSALGLPTGGFVGELADVSRDGSTAVGFEQDGPLEPGSLSQPNHGVQWRNDLLSPLPDPAAGCDTVRVSAVSADGSIAAGDCAKNFFVDVVRWTGAGAQSLGAQAGGVSAATAISGDGETVVGSGFDGIFQLEAFRWTQSSGIVGIGRVTGRAHSDAAGVSDDGKIVVGWSGETHGELPDLSGDAFLWDAAHGMRRLRDVLLDDYGLDVGAWHLWDASDVSGDGRFLTGTGINPSGLPEAWIIDLPEPSAGGVVAVAALALARLAKAGAAHRGSR